MTATHGRRGSSATAGRSDRPVLRRGEGLLRSIQAAAALWLIASPFVLTGPLVIVAVKDVAVGLTLLVVTAAASRYAVIRRAENASCLGLGLVLIAASIILEFGSGSAAAARQWNEVAVGVLLVYLSAAHVR